MEYLKRILISSLTYSPALNFDEGTCNCCHFGKGLCLFSGLYGDQDRVGSRIVFGLGVLSLSVITLYQNYKSRNKYHHRYSYLLDV